MPFALLLAMQAGGMIIDWLGKNEQVRLGRMGEKIEQAGIEASIYQTRLQTEDAGLQAMRQLRQNLGTQAAAFAARGVQGGTGTSVIFGQESTANFNADERMRRINQLGNEAQLKAKSTLSKLHLQTSENNIWNEFRSSTLNKIPTSLDAWSGSKSASSARSPYGFGFTPVGQ